jgi:hypothetical protein
MSRQFAISDRIVCLTNFERELDPRGRCFHPVLPKKGGVYVVRGTLDFGVPNCPIYGVYLVGC